MSLCSSSVLYTFAEAGHADKFDGTCHISILQWGWNTDNKSIKHGLLAEGEITSRN